MPQPMTIESLFPSQQSFLMKHYRFLCKVLLALALAGSLASRVQADGAKPLTVVIELVDGSMFRGQVEDRPVKLRTVYGEVRLQLADVAKITYQPTSLKERSARLLMNNGDELTGILNMRELSVKTLLGVLTVPLTQVRSVAVIPMASLSAPLVYYPFDGNANDEMKPGRRSILHGTALTEDRFGTPNAAYLIERGNYIDLGDILNDLDVPFTLSVWLNVGSEETTYQIFGTDRTPYGKANHYHGIFLTVGSKGDVAVGYGDGGVARPGSRRSISSIGRLPLGRWVHVAAVVQGPGTMKLYIDGVDVPSQISGSGSSMVHNELPAIIGGRYHGAIDDLALYGRALAEEEIKQLYHENGWNLGR